MKKPKIATEDEDEAEKEENEVHSLFDYILDSKVKEKDSFINNN